jgi:hypothetical protein
MYKQKIFAWITIIAGQNNMCLLNVVFSEQTEVLLIGLWCLTPLSTIFQLYLESVLLVEETGVPRENRRPVGSH